MTLAGFFLTNSNTVTFLMSYLVKKEIIIVGQLKRKEETVGNIMLIELSLVFY